MLGLYFVAYRRLKRDLYATQASSVVVLDAIPDGIITIKADGTICTVNPAAEVVFGHGASELLGRNITMLMPEPFASQHDAAMGNTSTHEAKVLGIEREILALRADGSTFPLEITVSVMPAGNEAKFVGVLRDASESREANHKLEQALKEAREATRCKGEFLANISHEIRTPMTAIIGYGELLALDDLNKAEAQEAAESILRSGKHLLSLISDVLDFSKMDAGKFEVELMRASPFAIVEGVCDIMRGQAQQKGLELNVDYLSALPAIVQTDPTKVRQALLNLVGNAIKFTESGSVCVTVSTIPCLGHAEDLRLCFEVTDTGVGIDSEVIDHLFSPFVQADNSTVRKFGGTGLGLSICKQIAQRLGGDVWVTSVLGRGSCFCFTVQAGKIPCAEDISLEDWKASAAISKPQLAQQRAKGRVSLLLVEDDPVNRKILKRMLRSTGALIDEAHDGQAAVEMALARTGKSQGYDVILMDMQMPVLDGLAATRKLREQGYGGSIVALTANSTQDARAQCAAAGCDDFVTKPISRERLTQLVNTHGGQAMGRAS